MFKEFYKYYILDERKCPNCGTWCKEELLNSYYCNKCKRMFII